MGPWTGRSLAASEAQWLCHPGWRSPASSLIDLAFVELISRHALVVRDGVVAAGPVVASAGWAPLLHEVQAGVAEVAGQFGAVSVGEAAGRIVRRRGGPAEFVEALVLAPLMALGLAERAPRWVLGRCVGGHVVANGEGRRVAGRVAADQHLVHSVIARGLGQVADGASAVAALPDDAPAVLMDRTSYVHLRRLAAATSPDARVDGVYLADLRPLNLSPELSAVVRG